MNVRLRSAVAVAATVATAAGLAVVMTGTASAVAPPYEPVANSIGTMTFYDAAGAVKTSGSITDDPFAAYAVASSASPAADTKATLYGYLPVEGVDPGAWSGEQLSAATTYPNTGAPSPVRDTTNPVVSNAAGDVTLATLKEDFPNNASDEYQGLYHLRMRTAGSASLSQYWVADILISGNNWTQVYPVPSNPTATVTTLVGSPATSQEVGDDVVLTATVTPHAAGTVQFKDGAGNLGSPVSVNTTTGQAALTTDALALGSHTLTAVFTPTDAGEYAGSTSDPLSYTITQNGTSVVVTGAPPVQQFSGLSVTFTATVTPNDVAGTVQFKDGTADLGAPVTVSSGTAPLTTSALAVGTHAVTAVFTPVDTTNYSDSTSSALNYKIVGAPSWKPFLHGAHRVNHIEVCFAAFDDATTVTYQWLLDGVVVNGATGQTFRVPETFFNKFLTCKVTATNPAGTTIGTSSAFKIGVGPTLVPTTRPFTYGPHRGGLYQYCNPGKWSPAATSYLYRWYVDGKRINGATANRFLVPRYYVGHVLQCVVDARRTNWTTGVFTTAKVRITP